MRPGMVVKEVKQWRDSLVSAEDDRLRWKRADDEGPEQLGQTGR